MTVTQDFPAPSLNDIWAILINQVIIEPNVTIGVLIVGAIVLTISGYFVYWVARKLLNFSLSGGKR